MERGVVIPAPPRCSRLLGDRAIDSTGVEIPKRQNVDHAAIWFDAATISELDREKIGRLNAKALFKL